MTASTDTPNGLANALGRPVDEWLADLEGEPSPGDGGVGRCDYCSGTIPPNRPVHHYATDLVYPTDAVGPASPDPGEGPMFVVTGYCQDCPRGRVLYPCETATELVFESRIDPDGRHRDVTFADASPVGQGYTWDPPAVYEAVMRLTDDGFSFDYYARAVFGGEGVLVGPQDVVDQLSAAGVDIRDAVDADGTLLVVEEASARRRVEQAMQEHDRQMADMDISRPGSDAYHEYVTERRRST